MQAGEVGDEPVGDLHEILEVGADLVADRRRHRRALAGHGAADAQGEIPVDGFGGIHRPLTLARS